MADLITVPHFVFEQGDVFEQVDRVERPINVSYWRETIELEQGGNSVLILPEYFEKLVTQIRKHQKAANIHLNKNK